MVAAPHCGAGSLSNDLTGDEISSTGGHHRFALAPVYTEDQRKVELIIFWMSVEFFPDFRRER